MVKPEVVPHRGQQHVGRIARTASEVTAANPVLVLAVPDQQRTVQGAMKGSEPSARWRLKHLFANGRYDRRQLMSQAAYRDFMIEVVRKPHNQESFQVLPRRQVVERSFGWTMRSRRLVRGWEARREISEAMIHVCMGS